jgi:hypothetical protein
MKKARRTHGLFSRIFTEGRMLEGEKIKRKKESRIPEKIGK